MYVTFYGAVREVTGSMHLVTTEHDRVLLDCGLFQGRRREAAEKNRVLPFDPGILTNVVLSHAHTDHSGRLPVVTKNGFTGRIVCTRATKSACEYLLPDSASIQESDADYLNYKTLRTALSQKGTALPRKNEAAQDLGEIKKLLKKGRHELNVETISDLMAQLRLEIVKPLYTLPDAEKALSHFDPYPYKTTVDIGNQMTCTFYDAGHILGSAISMVTAQENGRAVRVCFSGDIGRFDKPIINDPELVFAEAERDVDLLIMESTYGDRLHEPVADLKGQLAAVLDGNPAEGRHGPDPGLCVRPHAGAALRAARALQRKTPAARSDLRGQPAGGQPDPGVRRAPRGLRPGDPEHLSVQGAEPLSLRPGPAGALGGGVHGAQP